MLGTGSRAPQGKNGATPGTPRVYFFMGTSCIIHAIVCESSVDCGGPCPPFDPGTETQFNKPVLGDSCYLNVQWALEHSLPEHPEWYTGSCLTGDSDPAAVQAWFYSRMSQEGCMRSCADLRDLNLCSEPTVGGTNCNDACEVAGGGH